MSAEWLLKSFGVRFTVQRFTAWLETIRDSAAIFRQRGEYTVEEREKSLTRADAAIDNCVIAVEAGLADNFRAIGGHDPRDWFATTLTTAKKLQLQLRTLHDVLSERPDDWLTEKQQKELESLGGELRDRANLLESAASTLPPDTPTETPAIVVGGSTKTHNAALKGEPGREPDEPAVSVRIEATQATITVGKSCKTINLPSEGVARWLKVLTDHPMRWFVPEEYAGCDTALDGIKPTDKLRSLRTWKKGTCKKLADLIEPSTRSGMRFNSSWPRERRRAP